MPGDTRQSDARKPTAAPRLVLVCAIVVAGIGATSCVPPWSVHGLVTPADTLFDKRVLGRWVSPSLDVADTSNITRAEFDPVGGCRLTTRDEGGMDEWTVRPVRLGKHWFADCQVRRMAVRTDSTMRPSLADSVKSFHMIARMDVAADTLTLRLLDDEDMTKFVAQHPHRIGLTTVPDPSGDLTLLTDSTPRLRRFVLGIANVDSLFPIELALVRVR